jgi:hypothetical protein
MNKKASDFIFRPPPKQYYYGSIIIEIPDEIFQRLAPFQSQFSDLFTSLIATRLLAQPIPDSATPTADPNTSNTYQEILDFLIDQPTSAQIIKYP